MEIKDLLPLLGVALGWLLAEGSAFGKRAIERKRVLGKAISVLYFLFLEMVQIKAAQEQFKAASDDVKEWERLRQRSFKKYTVKGAEFVERLNSTADLLGEYYPIEAYKLREILNKYEFIKNKKLDSLTENREHYVRILSSYELGYLAHQYQLEKIVRFLAFRQSKLLWFRVRFKFWRLRRNVPAGDLVFLQQTSRSQRRAAKKKAKENGPESPLSKNDAGEA